MSKKRKTETDAELLSRYKQMEEYETGKGKTFDLDHELCAAMARRDYQISEKQFRRNVVTGQVVHYIIQLVLLVSVYANWEDMKIALTLLLVMLWRSTSYHSLEIKRLSVRSIELFAMAHPTAKDDFFRSEHCYDSEMRHRVFNLLHPRTTGR